MSVNVHGIKFRLQAFQPGINGFMSSLRYRAGKKAYEIIRREGLDFDRIGTFVGPAVGPRWLTASGFDLALLDAGVLGRSKPVLLAGSSAGAWRFAAWLQPEPIKSYKNLVENYSSIVYRRGDGPSEILESIKQVLNEYIEDDAIPFALTNKKYRLSVATARGKTLAGSEVHWIQKIGLYSAFLCNAINRNLLHRFFERVVFYYSPLPPKFCLNKDFRGRAIPLSPINFKNAVLASGAIPLVVAGVRDIYGAPNGVYRDGGIFDYHLNQDYSIKENDIVLLFHHQEKLIPGWLDKRLKKRRPPENYLDHVLMVHPSPEFIQRLPGGKVPDRDDFTSFMDDPGTRIRNWQKAVSMCSHFGEEFLETVKSGQVRDLVEKL